MTSLFTTKSSSHIQACASRTPTLSVNLSHKNSPLPNPALARALRANFRSTNSRVEVDASSDSSKIETCVRSTASNICCRISLSISHFFFTKEPPKQLYQFAPPLSTKKPGLAILTRPGSEFVATSSAHLKARLGSRSSGSSHSAKPWRPRASLERVLGLATDAASRACWASCCLSRICSCAIW